MGSSTTESMTPSELTNELRRLETELGITVELAEHLAAADALEADLYQVL